ncbi:MAG: hypothetical protein P1U40_02985 [Coxiellaceae bacterium]|nr:hypothetical protein [Coxiellaceae bacterium]
MIAKRMSILLTSVFAALFFNIGLAASYGDIKVVNNSTLIKSISIGGGVQNKELGVGESTILSRSQLAWGDNGTQQGTLSINTVAMHKENKYTLMLKSQVERNVTVRLFRGFIVLSSDRGDVVLNPGK